MLVAATTFAAPPLPSEALPTLDVPLAATPPVIDGEVGTGEWAGAAALALVFPWPEASGAQQPTTVRVLRSADALFVAFECTDRNVVATYEKRDDPVAREDCVEVFVLPPGGDATTYLGVEINARGTVKDFRFVGEGPAQVRFDFAALRASARRTATGWSVELALPLRELAGAAAMEAALAAPWRMQFARWDGAGDEPRTLSMWCHSGLDRPRPHNAARFGTVRFANASAAVFAPEFIVPLHDAQTLASACAPPSTARTASSPRVGVAGSALRACAPGSGWRPRCRRVRKAHSRSACCRWKISAWRRGCRRFSRRIPTR